METTRTARTLCALLAAAAVLAAGAAPARAGEPAASEAPAPVEGGPAALLLTGARLVDPRARQVTAGNLLLVDGRIAGCPAAVPEGFSGRVVDLAGKWVIPGLRDLHTHSYGNSASRDREMTLDPAHRERHARANEDRYESVRRLHRAGVPLLTGTDAGNRGVVQGFSLHRELELLVEAGLDPWDALAGSTTLAGDFLGRSWGLAEGDEASLVVLEASPLESIANTQRIDLVVHHGEVVDREALLD